MSYTKLYIRYVDLAREGNEEAQKWLLDLFKQDVDAIEKEAALLMTETQRRDLAIHMISKIYDFCPEIDPTGESIARIRAIQGVE